MPDTVEKYTGKSDREGSCHPGAYVLVEETDNVQMQIISVVT